MLSESKFAFFTGPLPVMTNLWILQFILILKAYEYTALMNQYQSKFDLHMSEMLL